MLCCKLDLPEPFSWKIKAFGKCVGLLDELRNIMQLSKCSDERAELLIMPRLHYDSSGNEYSSWRIFYSRKAVRMFRNDALNKYLMVLPEDILSEGDISYVLMWLMLKAFYIHCISKGALPVHASSADLNGRGIIVAAAGDTGKTTTIRRLPKPWVELADDTALILPQGDEFYLYPLPTWSEFIHGRDKSASWNVKEGTKLSGIFFLKQSKRDKTECLSPPLAMISLYQSSIEAVGEIDEDMSNSIKTEIFETAASIRKKVPVFSLYATLTGKVWKSIENALSDEQWK